ncbi:hypothetical protein Golomagni_07561 [Golovinomyces magnicellulatus]|nr:hypothetical protein Golomagni_07561 [Golovinomyces magnicellulatus]
MASRAASVLRPLLRQRASLASTAFSLSARRAVATPVLPLSIHRAAHSIPKPPSSTPKKPNVPEHKLSSEPKSEGERPDINPAYYQLSFTCMPCSHRSHHNISKQGYHTGSILITCPSCRNRHVISDNLNIFGDRKINVEDLMREKGRLVKKGSLGEDGDIEFWPEEDAASTAEADNTKSN